MLWPLRVNSDLMRTASNDRDDEGVIGVPRAQGLLNASGYEIKRRHRRQELAPATVVAAVDYLKTGGVESLYLAALQAAVGIATAAQPAI
jgi:hypothetical protein